MDIISSICKEYDIILKLESAKNMGSVFNFDLSKIDIDKIYEKEIT